MSDCKSRSRIGCDSLHGSRRGRDGFGALATLTKLSEEEVIRQLDRYTAVGMVTHRKVHGMNYYRLDSDTVRQKLSEALKVPR